MAGVCCTHLLETRLVSFLPWGFRKIGTETGSSVSPLQPPDAITLLFFTAVPLGILPTCSNINLWAITFDSWTDHGQAPSAAGWTWAAGNGHTWCILTADLEESLYCVATVRVEKDWSSEYGYVKDFMQLLCQCTRCSVRLVPPVISQCPKKGWNENGIIFFSPGSLQFTRNLPVSLSKWNYTSFPHQTLLQEWILIQINLGRTINLFKWCIFFWNI